VGGRVKMDEESYVFPCKIRMLNDHSELKVNMSVNVDISTKQNENALLVPREALISKDDSSFVYVINRNRARERNILIGIRSYTSIEATSGLVEGELVAITNVSKLKDKGRVKIER
jgi:multidrug efflux pump subunit AcrA (membrane-fusion protein)